MRTNEDVLLDEAKMRTIAGEHCNICGHCGSRKERCGHIIETCHHPMLSQYRDGGWPEVNVGMVCDWFKAKDFTTEAADAKGSEA